MWPQEWAAGREGGRRVWGGGCQAVKGFSVLLTQGEEGLSHTHTQTHTHTHTHTSDGLRAVASGKPLHKAKLFHLEECPLLQDKTLPVFFGNKSAFCFETVGGMGRGDMVCFLRSY